MLLSVNAMKIKNYKECIDVPVGVAAHVDGSLLIVSKGEVVLKRNFRHPKIKVTVAEGKISLHVDVLTRREKTILGSFRAHMKNMIKGVQEPFEYKLKVCSGHFPMNISVSQNKFIVKNFIGEKVPRLLHIDQGIEVKIEGDVIIVTSHDKEKAGRTAGAIEILCSRPGFDKRIFQQGIYIMEKAGKEM